MKTNTQKKQYQVRGILPFHNAVNMFIGDFTRQKNETPDKDVYLEFDFYNYYDSEGGRDYSLNHRIDGRDAIEKIFKNVMSRQMIDWEVIEEVAKNFESKYGFGADDFSTYEEFDAYLASL